MFVLKMSKHQKMLEHHTMSLHKHLKNFGCSFIEYEFSKFLGVDRHFFKNLFLLLYLSMECISRV